MEEQVKLAIGILAEQGCGFKFGDPWRYSDASVVAVVPILRDSDRARTYITFAEARGSLEVKEVGQVNELEVLNKGDVDVLLRAGEVLAGGTQERMPVADRVVEAGEKTRIPVVCIHQTRGLRLGEIFKPHGYIPRVMYSHYRHAYEKESSTHDPVSRARATQGAYWSGIRSYSSMMMAGGSPLAQGVGEGVPGPTTSYTPVADDLLATMTQYTQSIKDVISKVPSVENQVGLATIGLDGLLALECYDLKGSWAAIREAAVTQHGEDLSKILSDADQVFRYEPENAGKAIRAALVKTFETEQAGIGKNWQVFILKGDKFHGEVTFHHGEMIHLLVARAG